MQRAMVVACTAWLLFVRDERRLQGCLTISKRRLKNTYAAQALMHICMKELRDSMESGYVLVVLLLF